MLSDAQQATKVCTKCGEAKPLAQFGKAKQCTGGLNTRCKACVAEVLAAWYQKNKQKVNERAVAWKQANRERVREAERARVKSNIEVYRKKAREHARRVRATARGKLENNIRKAIHSSIVKGSKNGKPTFALLGYTVDDLKRHLEAQFQPGMTWENYGPVWHIDHIIPLAAHNYQTPYDIDFGRAWALSNLQPLWAVENKIKRASTPAGFQPSLALG